MSLTDNQIISSLTNFNTDKNHEKLYYYQVIPKYYLGSGSNIIIIYYSMGFGKTLSALHIINNHIVNTSVTSIIHNFLPSFEGTSNNVYVVASWQTKNQIDNDIKRNILHNDKLLIDSLPDRMDVMGYQAFYNFIFGRDQRLLSRH